MESIHLYIHTPPSPIPHFLSPLNLLRLRACSLWYASATTLSPSRVPSSHLTAGHPPCPVAGPITLHAFASPSSLPTASLHHIGAKAMALWSFESMIQRVIVVTNESMNILWLYGTQKVLLHCLCGILDDGLWLIVWIMDVSVWVNEWMTHHTFAIFLAQEYRLWTFGLIWLLDSVTICRDVFLDALAREPNELARAATEPSRARFLGC